MTTALAQPRAIKSTDRADLKMRQIAARLANEMLLTLEKAAAHNERTAKYPVPRNSAEAQLASRMGKLSPRQQRKLSRGLMKRVEANAATRAEMYGDLARVDLNSGRAIAELVKTVPIAASQKMRVGEVDAFRNRLGGDLKPVAATPAFSKLDLRLHKVVCTDDTDLVLEFEGKDEILLDVIATAANGDSTVAPRTDLGQFKDGQNRVFATPKTLATFDLSGVQPPVALLATVIMTEKDFGDSSQFINLILEQLETLVKDRVDDFITEQLGGTAGKTGTTARALNIPPVLIPVITTLIAMAVEKVFDAIAQIFGDEIFPPQILPIAIPSLTEPFPDGNTDSAEETIEFEGFKGLYKIVVDWRVRL
jgi:hypothetical protein